MKDIWPLTILRGIKTALITIGCLASYIILPALFAGLLLFLLAIIYSVFSLAWIFISSL